MTATASPQLTETVSPETELRPSARLSAAPAGYPAPMYPHKATEEQHREHRIRSFQPRRGRMTKAQAGALDRGWEQYGLAIDGTPLDLVELFEGRPVTLEIGFGMGDTTATMAAADPTAGILAADVHTPATATCCSSWSATTPATSGWPPATPSSCSATCSPTPRWPVCGSTSPTRGPSPSTTSGA